MTSTHIPLATQGRAALPAPVAALVFQRFELLVKPRTKGEYRCPACNQVLETFDGGKFIAYRLIVQPLVEPAFVIEDVVSLRRKAAG
jgi:hypothetical protein